MKKGTKIFLGILILLLLVCVGLLIWQWDNINALRQSYTMTPEEVQAQIEANQKALRDTLEQYNIPAEEITEETINQIISGELSIEEAVKAFQEQLPLNPKPSPNGSPAAGKGGSQASPKPDAPKPEDNPQQDDPQQDDPQQDTPSDSPDRKLQIDLSTLYILQEVYVHRLDIAVQEAAEVYSTDRSLFSEKVKQLMALEDECDQQVYAIIVDIRSQLKASGQEQDLADEVEAYYLSEKNMKKAQYMQKYRG